jgi:hypothetical protein
MPVLRILLCSAAVFATIGCIGAQAMPLTYTMTFTENDNNGDATGTGQFTIDSALFINGANDYDTIPMGAPYAVSDVVSAFTVTFSNVGPNDLTETYTYADLTGVEIMVDPANSPPIDWAFFETSDNGTSDYMFGNSDIPGQTIQNDPGGFTGFAETISGPDAPVPEPASLMLLGAGTAALGMARRRRKA